MRATIPILAFMMLVLGTVANAEKISLDRFHESLTAALLDMGMTPEDFRIRYDYVEPDIFRLPLVDSLMNHPSALPVEMDALARRMEMEPSICACAGALWDAMSVEPAEAVGGTQMAPKVEDVAGTLGHLPPALAAMIAAYAGHLANEASLREKAVAKVTPDLAFLYENMSRLLSPSPDYDEIDPFELHRLEKEGEALTDSVLGILENVDIAAVAAMSLEALRCAEDMDTRLAGIPPRLAGLRRYRGRDIGRSGAYSSVGGQVLYMGDTPWGAVVVGDTSRTVYDGCFALIIDLGGDDVYNLTNHPDVYFRLILDEDGDDIYRSTDSFGVAGAVFGTSVVLDRRGNDTYRSGGISLGAGVCGVGAIADDAGNDSYTSGIFSQGAGFLGLGILVDGGGNDTYVARMQSQAFGYVMGSGLLLDCSGNDAYLTQMSETDILRYDDHYLTLSQGCAFGSRPHYSGGIGLLVDSQGNDIYSSDIFGQGVAYWFAVGALVDRGGHDRYSSYQYAQGSGVHLAFGLLLDSSGDDAYTSKGVSQGCGHDLSLGLLADFSGNDWYTATDLGQGAGSANGIGIIYDGDGDDVYAAKNVTNVNGYGDYRREFGSIGLDLDMDGRDFYSARGENGSIWESGTYGLGVDVPGQAKSPAGDLMVKELPLEVRDFTSEDLFVLSARGEPRFREWREYAFDRMVRDTAATIAYLRSILDAEDARERHTIKDILRTIGEPAVPMLAEAVIEDGPLAKSEASWILGLIGSREAFDPLLGLSRAEGWQQRSSALNAIAKLNDLTPPDLERLAARIDEVLADTSEVFYVRKDAAYASGRQAICGSLGLLIRALEDRHYAVRFSAAEAIRDLSKSDCRQVAEMIAARLPEMRQVGAAAALYAAGSLPPAEKLLVAEALMASRPALTTCEETALARLLAGVEPETSEDRKRLDEVARRLPGDDWRIRAIMGSE
jgi:HEAT repeat protein